MAPRNAEIIKAYAEGREIQYKIHGDWYTYNSMSGDYNTGPWSSTYFEWRIAPKKVMLRHGKIVSTGTIQVFLKNYNLEEDRFSSEYSEPGNVDWLDDWHEASFGPER